MDTLKKRLQDHYDDLVGDFDQEELDLVAEILNESKSDDLKSITSKWDLTLLERMIHNDTELQEELSELLMDLKPANKDPFS